MKDRAISFIYFTLSAGWIAACVWIIAVTR